MRTLICGGRNFRDFQFLNRTLQEHKDEISLIICGAQRSQDSYGFYGADWFAIEWALQNQIPFIGVPAQWNKYPKYAGTVRNVLLVDDWKPNQVFAFPGNNGTRDMINIAKAAGVPVKLFGW